jgi:hypothetical protein
VVDEHGEAGHAGGAGVLQHLPVARAVAGREDRAAAQLGLDVLDLRPALVDLALRLRGAHQRGPVAVLLVVVLDQRADHVVGAHAVELPADRADELGAAAGDDEDIEVVLAQHVQQLQHRLVDQLRVGHAPVRVLLLRHEVAHPGGELVRCPARAQLQQCHGDALQAQLAERRVVAVEQRPVLGALAEAGVVLDGVVQRAHEEAVLDVVRLLAPQRAVVVEHGHPLLRGQRQRLVQERRDRVAGGARPPGGQERHQ